MLFLIYSGDMRKLLIAMVLAITLAFQGCATILSPVKAFQGKPYWWTKALVTYLDSGYLLGTDPHRASPLRVVPTPIIVIVELPVSLVLDS